MLQKLLRRVRGKAAATSDDLQSARSQRRGFRGDESSTEKSDAARSAGRAGGGFTSGSDADATPRPTADNAQNEKPTPRES